MVYNLFKYQKRWRVYCMARQGKMHGSPFHVENQFYKYAVEHDGVDKIKSEHPNCEYWTPGSSVCKKWNVANGKLCKHFVCRFYKTETRRKNICAQCAFCYNLNCKHPKRPPKEPETDDASFCYYFFGKKDDEKKFNYIRTCLERISLTEEKHYIERSISKKNKYIRQATKALQDVKQGSELHKFYTDKIKAKNADAQKQAEELSKIIKRLEQLGGELDKLPTKKKK